ncbi:MAG: excalibur calcium-binding domain-containing protein [Sphingopyxis sp.]|nr:excalibur calcium-binding domain-containing protein [Sphingopyxis sp.]
MRHTVICAAAVLSLSPAPTNAHGGGLAADGCHNDRKNGGRHCHRAPARSAPSADRPQRLSGGNAYFANCTAARAAGAAPVRRGDAGYARHLDRDGDGVGCE